jgi:O-antigen ligase
MLLKYISEKVLVKIISFLTLILALSPGIYLNAVIYPYVTAKTIIFRIFVSLMLFLYIWLILKNKKYLPSKNNLLISFFLFIVTCFFSGILSNDPSQSFWSTPERMMGTFNLIHFFLFILIISSVIKSKEAWIKLIHWWNILIVSTGCIALYTFITKHIATQTSIFSDRFYGFAGNPIFFAAIVLIFFYFNLYLFFEKLQKQQKGLWWHILIAIIYVVFIALTGSRGAFLALGITGFIFLISFIFNPNNELNYLLKINVQKISLIVLISLLTICSTIFIFKNNDFVKNNYILHRLTSINLKDGSSFSRIIVSKIGINCFLQKPFFGYGFDNFEICYQNNFDTMMVEVLPRENRFDKAHNMPIEILATTGIIGFVFFACIYIFGYKNIRDLMIENKINFYAGLSLILGVVAYLIQNMFVFDVFEGFIGFCLLLAYIIFLSNNKNFNLNLDKISFKIKDLILILSLILIGLNIYWFNLYIFYYDNMVKRVDYLVSNGKVEIALNNIKNLHHIRSPYKDALYFGFFDTFIKNQKNMSKKQLEEYYSVAFKNQQFSYKKYPYRTHIYLVQLLHIASKAINPEIKIQDNDVENATEIINLTKKYNINQPEIDFFYLQILFNSDNKKDWILGEEMVKNSIKTYPESARFYWIYGIHLIDSLNQPDEGIKYLIKSYEKEIVFESIDQVMTTVINLNKYNEPDYAIKVLQTYIPGNPKRFQLFMELSKSYILKNDLNNAKKALDQAKKVYKEEKFTKYSVETEEKLKELEIELNKLSQ